MGAGVDGLLHGAAVFLRRIERISLADVVQLEHGRRNIVHRPQPMQASSFTQQFTEIRLLFGRSITGREGDYSRKKNL